ALLGQEEDAAGLVGKKEKAEAAVFLLQHGAVERNGDASCRIDNTAVEQAGGGEGEAEGIGVKISNFILAGDLNVIGDVLGQSRALKDQDAAVGEVEDGGTIGGGKEVAEISGTHGV